MSKFYNKTMDELKKEVHPLQQVTDIQLNPKQYIIVVCDGRSFSKLIKKRFKLPFDDNFISIMNETAKYVASKIEGCLIAYTQSDEISFIIHASELSVGFCKSRLCKLQSLIAAMCTGKFITEYIKRTVTDVNDIDDKYLIQFDCKAWNVPNQEDAFKWLVYRQMDCNRNAKQQFAQTYASHKSLLNLTPNQQIEKINEDTGINFYNDIPLNCQLGRIIKKEEREVTNEYGTALRHYWEIHDAPYLNDDEQYKMFLSLWEIA